MAPFFESSRDCNVTRLSILKHAIPDSASRAQSVSILSIKCRRVDRQVLQDFVSGVPDTMQLVGWYIKRVARRDFSRLFFYGHKAASLNDVVTLFGAMGMEWLF